MKLKYLPDEEKKTIRMLKKITDTDEMANVLDKLMHRPFTLQILWEYRKWFQMLTEEQLQSRAGLMCGLAQIHILAGELDEAKVLIEKMPEGSRIRLLTEFMLPDLELSQREDIFQKIKALQITMTNVPALTAGKASVINGNWDFTPYASWFVQNKEKTIQMFSVMHPEDEEKIYELFLAEIFYQQDRCYDALIIVVNMIPMLKEKQELKLLFVALRLEICILVLNNQTSSSEKLLENVRHQMTANDLKEYLPNIDALAAWAAMYDGNYALLTRWMREDAPDERDEFFVLDMFCYMIKLRGYIIQRKYLAVTSMASWMKPYLEKGKRYMDLCELQLLWAMSDYAAGQKDMAFEHLEEALNLAKRYQYHRLIADEGRLMHSLLKDYRKNRGKSSYLNKLIDMTEKTALLHPYYLKSQLPEKTSLTDTEMKVLRLLADNRTNGEIAETLDIAVNTVKQHCRHICQKLEVKNRHQAVQRAVELGVLEAVKK